MRLAYEGLDGATRATVVLFDPVPELPAPDRACFQVDLPPHASETFTIIIRCEGPEGCGPTQTYEAAWEAAARRGDQRRSNWCTLFTANEQFNEWCNRSAADLQMMTTELATGPYAYAGVPWFSTPFGRDGIITALEGLWANPDLARGTLAYLASTQARTARDDEDAEPGKILHETRAGEMARLREVPFGCYYGSVDATPLFVILAGCYYARTGDRDFIAGIWEHVDRALGWIDQYGDRDGDGFVEYARRSPTGLVHQGWKDSSDSVMHADGTLAEAPIALCEVQAYVFEAKRQGAWLAALLGLEDRARALARQAEALRERFEGAFWCDDLGTYALALDGDKRPCRVRTSNAGHCLFAGIAGPGPRRARRRHARSTRRSSRDGVSGRWRRRRSATTRCRTTTGRSGRTTTRSSGRASRATGCARRSSAFSQASSTPVCSSIGSGCRSSSAASAAARAKGPRSTRSRARRSRGRRARCSCCSPRWSA